MLPRTTGAIALHPTGNAQGGQYFYSLTTGRRLRLNHLKVLPMSADVVTRIHRLSSAPSYNDAEDDEEEKEDDDYNLAVDDAKIAGVNNDDDTIDDDDDDDSDDDDALVALDDGNNAELAMDLELTMAPEPNFDATDPDTDATDEIDNARPGADKTT
jgi:hypothetical protein